jgi:membrane-bound lytic murein transglycosylase B
VGELVQAGVAPQAALDQQQLVIPLSLEVDDTAWRYRLGYENFYVITRYNHSHLYAMAVTELAEAISATRELEPFPLSVAAEQGDSL